MKERKPQPKLEQTPEGWDGAVDDYEATVERITARFARPMLDQLSVGPGTQLLDVAAGAGVIEVEAARRGADVLATDFSPRMIERLQQRLIDDGLPQVNTMTMNALELELPNGSMDAITCNFGAMFFPDPGKCFKEMHRVLRPNGAAAVTTWGPRETNGLQMLMGEAIQQVLAPPKANAAPPAPDMSDPGFFRDLLLSAGFASVEITTLSEPWVTDSARSIERFVTTNPASKPMLEQLSPEKRHELIETLVNLLEERAVGGLPTLYLGAHLAVARKA
ncbi:MAG: class I SAM-dependent methyltransferase [Chloroflexi bacterium]|nr:class I SAM-dependent methyltransferase [Chloroflexota bacterium]